MTLFLCRYKIEHMIKYKYVPIEIGKKKYKKAEATEIDFWQELF